MSFFKRFAAIATTTVIATGALAEGHTSELLSNFSITAYSAGDLVANGSPNTVFTAAKDAFSDVQLGTDTIGDGCGIDCVDTVGNASAFVAEIASINSFTVGDTSGELFGSSASLALDAGIQLDVADASLRDTTSVDVYGDVYGLGTGDDVSVVTNRESFAKVQQNMDYHGPLCDDLCGNTTQGTWAMGGMIQTAHVTAAGHEAIAISNVTSGSISGLLENYKAVGQ